MPEESTTPDLVELVRRSFQAAGAKDFDTLCSFYRSDAVYDMSPMGLGTYNGLVAIRGFFEDWMATFEDFEIEAEEIVDLGRGVGFAVVSMEGRPAGGQEGVNIRLRYGSLGVWRDGLIVRNTNYGDIDQGRAAAERLAESRG